MNGINIPVPPGVNARAVLALLLASASNVQAATAALLRRANSEALTISEDEARAAVRYVRAWGTAEIAKVAAPSNAVAGSCARCGSLTGECAREVEDCSWCPSAKEQRA